MYEKPELVAVGTANEIVLAVGDFIVEDSEQQPLGLPEHFVAGLDD
jgi:hypothetical protein